MRVLISAYACEPGKGSEPGVGWNLVRELSSRVELWVITRSNNRGAIEAAGEEWVGRVHWIYWDPPAWLTFWKKGGRGVQAFYLLWQHGVLPVARSLVKAERIEVVHHLTFGKYWVPSRLAALPCPFLFGPVGGGEETPPHLKIGESTRARWSSLAKNLASRLLTRNPWSLKLYRQAAWTFAATEQTATRLRRLGVSRLSLLPQSGLRPDDLPSTVPATDRPTGPERELVLVTAARLIPWKAIDLAIEAVAMAAKRIPVRLVVLQTGPELTALRALASRLGISDRVEFKGKLPTLDDVYREIAKADALVHPALHEAFGQACLESLGLGIPVICLNWGGPGLIVNEATGFAVESGNREETLLRLAAAMIDLNTEIQSGRSRATACRARAFGSFHWESLADRIVEKYTELHSGPPPTRET